MSLAAKLPYDHAFAGGYPGIGSQPLPTDADAIDYLSRMATADGAGVEVGVAVAVDAFFRDAKDSGVFSALKACCILAGARTLAGALVPVVGDAPTNLPVANGFTSGDYSRAAGLTGDGTSYLDSGRDSNDDPQNDQHVAVYSTTIASGNDSLLGADNVEIGTTVLQKNGGRCRSTTFSASALTPAAGFAGFSRNAGSSYHFRTNGENEETSISSQSPGGSSLLVFARDTDPVSGFSDPTMAFYSIGTSLGSNPADGLAALDTTVSNLINRLKFALLVGENPSGLDPDTIDYIVRGYEAGGSLE